MKTLRYLLSVIAVVSVLGVSAQTPKYGKPYQPHNSNAKYSAVSETTIPAATIGSVDAGYMQSGSNLPMAAQSGVTTTYDNRNNAPGGPRKGWGTGEGGGSEGGEPGDWHEPWEDPIGDAMWPLMLIACAYCAFLIIRTRKREAR